MLQAERFTGFFNLPNPSSCTMALGMTQSLTEMSTRNFPRGKRQPAGWRIRRTTSQPSVSQLYMNLHTDYKYHSSNTGHTQTTCIRRRNAQGHHEKRHDHAQRRGKNITSNSRKFLAIQYLKYQQLFNRCSTCKMTRV
jgi:hypothetical protein